MAVNAHLCPNCGGGIRFDIGKGMFVCGRCGSEFSSEFSSEFNGDKFGGNSGGNLNDGMSMGTYSCPTCGAEVFGGKETLAAGNCAFCQNPVTVSEKLISSGDLPAWIIPFKKTKEEARAVFLEKCKNKPLAPRAFLSAAKAGELKSVYIPFRLYDCDCQARMTARCENVTTWSEGEYDCRKTDVYSADRAGTMRFERVPVDMSEKIEDADMQAIEPFDLNELTKFTDIFMAGHLAEAPTTKNEALNAALGSRLSPAANETLCGTVSGYDSVTVESSNMDIVGQESEYAMYPVWILSSEWNGKRYIFSINGQTGKFAGKLPVDWRFAGFLYLIIALITCAAVIIGWEAWLWIFG